MQGCHSPSALDSQWVSKLAHATVPGIAPSNVNAALIDFAYTRRMNRFLRLVTLFLLVIALPFNGMAGIDSPIEPCPMQAMGMQMMAGMEHDCCQEQDQGKSSHHDTKTCKVGQECRTATALQVSMLEPVLTFATSHPADTYTESLVASAQPDHWRPPRA